MKILLALLLSSMAYGDPETDLHATAHIGASFALQTVFYGVNKELGLSKPRAEALAYAETMLIGFVYKKKPRISQRYE